MLLVAFTPWILLIWLLMFAVGGSLFAYAMWAEKKRREDIQQLAESLNLEYLEALPFDDQQRFDAFPVASKGRRRQAKNVIIADSGALRMLIFDYQFVVGSGKNKKTHRQTVVMVNNGELSVPQFSLAPESFFDRIGGLFGMQDFDFDEDPEFSNAFLLRGDDEPAVRDYFNATRRQAFLEYRDACVQGQGGTFVLYHRRSTWNAEEIKTLMEKGFSMNAILG